MVSFLRKVLPAIMAAGVSFPAFAYTSDITVGFGPYVGTGRTTTKSAVRHTSGYSLIIDRNYELAPGWALGPRFEATNGFVNTRGGGATVEQTTYDNRIFAAGFRLSRGVGADSAEGLYLSGVAGRSYSKMQVDLTSDTLYEQTRYHGIVGNYYAGELGAFIPVRGSFGVNLAFLSSLIEADLGQARGTYEGDELVDGQLRLTQGSRTAGEAGLSERVSLRTYAARIGVSLGF